MEVTIEEVHTFVGLPACSTQDDCIVLSYGAFLSGDTPSRSHDCDDEKKKTMYLRR